MIHWYSVRRNTDFASVRLPNRWDWVLLPLLLALLAALSFAAMQMSHPFVIGQATPISLDPVHLPYYLLRTVLRMFIALFFSLLAAVAIALLAAKSSFFEKLAIPAIDVLQSVPILGFQAIAVAPFVALFPGNILAFECAAIFALFSSQAWNMAFSLYQSILTVPGELGEAARVFRLSGWQRFWRLELPFALPNLLWNMMMSMSGGWFFLVAAEAITVDNKNVKLPGIGSYIATAIEVKDLTAIFWAIGAMLVGIVLYDQIFFRPLLAWADKFRFEETQGETAPQSWLLNLLHRSRWLNDSSETFWNFLKKSLGWFARTYDGSSVKARPVVVPPWRNTLNNLIIAALVLGAAGYLVLFIHRTVGVEETLKVFGMGLFTLARVVVLIALASLVWVPVSVWIGLRPRWSQKIQAGAQFLAAFPVNLLFPLVVFVLVKYRLNPDIWLTPLMIFGTQWYILFNVVGGASTIPTELRLAADNLGLKGWLKWKRVYLPAVFPSYVTGAITACGGCWNASIVSEYVSWGDTTLTAHGLGSYITQVTNAGDFHRIALGISVMCIFVMILNRTFWHRLYVLAESRGS